MNIEIFLPIFYMLCLTVIVTLFSTLIRIKEIYINDKKNEVSGSEMKHPPFNKGSDILKNAQRNLVNLFEFPIFFYVVCIIIAITNKVDEQFITLAYWFFYLRLAHSIYHIFFNQVVLNIGLPLRAFIWVPSIVIIIWMWVRLISII